MDLDTIEHSVKDILEAIGEDVDREGLLKTPHRVAKAYTELLAGYRMDPRELINEAVFTVGYDEMVIVRDIEFYSMCEHHMLPFIGRCMWLISRRTRSLAYPRFPALWTFSPPTCRCRNA